MNIVPVEEALAHHPSVLSHPDLNVLKADDTLYTVLLLQPEGRIAISERAIGHADVDLAAASIGGFLSIESAMEARPDLVVCPEYSVPWEVLIGIIENGGGPQVGKLWALGCESLPLNALATYRERLGNKAIFIDEGVSISPITTQRYRNPLVYVFRTNDKDGVNHLVLLVQYKTATSGDSHNIEARGMLPGSQVYIFGRTPGELRLMTLICSDVFELTSQQIKTYYDGLLLIHPQLNNNPRHPVYKPYRRSLFEFGGRTELLCLNWAQNINVINSDGSVESEWKNIGGSAWYLAPKELDLSDSKITENHRNGLYYTRHESIKAHALQFHYEPRVFLVEATKVFHHGVVKPKSHLTGPRVLETFHWSSEKAQWISSSASEKPVDGFEALLARVAAGVALDDLEQIYQAGPVAVERVLAISAGEFGPKSNWYDAERVDSMQLCQEEIVRRVTVTQDPEGASFRSNRIGAARALAALRQANHPWPGEVEFLRNGFRLRWSQDYPNRNVVATNGMLATLIYAGQVGDPAILERLDQRVRQTLIGTVPEPDRVLNKDEFREYRKRHYSKAERLCIVCHDGSDIVAYRSPKFSSFTSPAGISPVDIAIPAPRRSIPDVERKL
ncbi:hypothetical protein [Variovorax sp. 770b2]|uniref:hypothetical protein n=1 Tax=Variovorax sp. 770b2 TaxID=1566271 RepID=UPI0008E854ED|nr:hypothetical protein [Variovorax sp. 770b2]SFP99479.1 hypothetical protein SAMN03159339_4953 [Variovorax sp. 770b2]